MISVNLKLATPLLCASMVALTTPLHALARSGTPVLEVASAIIERYQAGLKKGPPKPMPPDVEFSLGRLFAMAALDRDARVSVEASTKLPRFSLREPMFGSGRVKHEDRTDRANLERAFHHFRAAAKGEYDEASIALAVGWCSEQTGSKSNSILENYRTAMKTAWEREQSAATLETYPISLEAATHLIPLLDPKTASIDVREAKEIASEARAKFLKKAKPRGTAAPQAR